MCLLSSSFSCSDSFKFLDKTSRWANKRPSRSCVWQRGRQRICSLFVEQKNNTKPFPHPPPVDYDHAKTPPLRPPAAAAARGLTKAAVAAAGSEPGHTRRMLRRNRRAMAMAMTAMTTKRPRTSQYLHPHFRTVLSVWASKEEAVLHARPRRCRRKMPQRR